MKLTLHGILPKPKRMSDDQPIESTLRRLIAQRKGTLKAVAKDANVDYQALRRWYVRTSSKLDVAAAEKLHKHLTGKGFQ